MENAEKKFSQYVNLEEGTIRISCGNTFGSSFLYNAIQIFPKINIEISSHITTEAIDLLSKGNLDIVIFKMTNRELPKNVEVIEGREDELRLYASKKYLKEHIVKSYADLKNCNIIFTGKNSNTTNEINEFFKQI